MRMLKWACGFTRRGEVRNEDIRAMMETAPIQLKLREQRLRWQYGHCLIALLIVNRRLTLSTRGLRSLSCRYQITENVRALRLLVPLVLFDTCVSVADMTGTLFFEVRPEFQPGNCTSTPLYLPAYVVLRLIDQKMSGVFVTWWSECAPLAMY
ncbi:hypothetical protein ANCDUO_07981 [Ancylostoma duodenale]|uniref:Uncharacterized protein n=1 Tax=Ancylostoma duodenale TaxID=51022 RepID=A0A0C2DH09_9BILA|nr:hypothetical protein ANCDUO_07981 [Ancylostoma duodenale]